MRSTGTPLQRETTCAISSSVTSLESMEAYFKPYIQTVGISWQTLYFTKESPDQVRGIIEAYKQGMNREQAGIYEKGFTRGLYYRNVL